MKLTRSSDAQELPVSHDPNLSKRVLLKKGLAQPILQVSEFTLFPGDRITPHTHKDATEVFYLLEGTAGFFVDGISVILAGGDLLVIEPGEEHFMVSHSNEAARLFCFLLLN